VAGDGEQVGVGVGEVGEQVGEGRVVPPAEGGQPIRRDQVRLGGLVGLRRPAADHGHQPLTGVVEAHAGRRGLAVAAAGDQVVEAAVPGDEPAGALVDQRQLGQAVAIDRCGDRLSCVALGVAGRGLNVSDPHVFNPALLPARGARNR
jgi:hypothetical protein